MLVRRLTVASAVLFVVASLGSACSSSPKHPPPLPPGGGGSGGTRSHKEAGGGQGGTDAGDASTEAEAGGSAGTDASAGSGGTSGTAGSGGTGGTAGSGGTAGTDAGDAGLPAHCSNGKKDQGETDVDCGGSCAPCATGSSCAVGTDCQSQVCDSTKRTCNAPSCSDNVKNGTETDVDCGGTCTPCDAGKACLLPKDCASGVCSGTPLTCQAATCKDGVKNGTETDKDCGGGSCPTCGRGATCVYNSDCATDVCDIKHKCACPNGMITVPLPGGGGGSFCIDQYEVTYAEYTAFYNANPPAQIAACNWKKNYTPSANWPGSDAYPVRDVDWCDAYAYCAAMGKRLCGAIGGKPGDYAKYDNPNVSQWFDACSAQGTKVYPYTSPTFDASTCNGAGYQVVDGGVVLGPLPGMRPYPLPANVCIGGEPDLYDMSGNVAEWTDECQQAQDGGGPAADTCRVRGGGYKDTGSAMACAASRAMRRDATADDVGFRCCLD